MIYRQAFAINAIRTLNRRGRITRRTRARDLRSAPKCRKVSIAEEKQPTTLKLILKACQAAGIAVKKNMSEAPCNGSKRWARLSAQAFP
ncbi:unnamed protein product [Ceratitis capitata]|uniref:(Mediterranean fruit fly) hypothetical protein n=1 Tax=Ceratitis capitata TaxID=7213 RepID=A0A811VJR0_CERCA|nr:unnamed protein product [Ceratitis capitata]